MGRIYKIPLWATANISADVVAGEFDGVEGTT
jgi:hypothetical protein